VKAGIDVIIVATALVGASANVAAQDSAAAMALAEKHLCLSCHRVDSKLVGPAYKDVAAKYKGDATALDELVAKVMKGGKGVWGQTPMPANKDVPEADVRTIVTWVMSL
jgi:cytochrome c